jgi:hypothetical protein
MASAREPNTREETSDFVAQLSGGLDQVLKNADAAAAARRASASAIAATPAASGAIAGRWLTVASCRCTVFDRMCSPCSW